MVTNGLSHSRWLDLPADDLFVVGGRTTSRGTPSRNGPSGQLVIPVRRSSAGGKDMKVSEVRTRQVEVAAPDDTLQKAAARMAELDSGVLPVGEGDRLV